MTSLQHMQALAQAQEVKRKRFRLKTEIRALPVDQGRCLLAEALVDVPDFLTNVPVLSVLQWPTRTGEVRAEEMMRAARAGLTLRVGDLSPRQRVDLARCLRGLTALVEGEAVARESEVRFLAERDAA